MNRTKWIPPEIKPVRVGVYQRKYIWGIDYSYFDGEDWSSASESVEEAVKWSFVKVYTQVPWRGLLRQASVATP